MKNDQLPRYLHAAKRGLLRITKFPCAMSKVFLTVILERIGNAEKREPTGASACDRHDQPIAKADKRMRQHRPVLFCSYMTQFWPPLSGTVRAQGALEAWTNALEKTGLWPLWRDPGRLCWQIRQEILRQLECIHAKSSVAGQISAECRASMSTSLTWTCAV